MHDDGTGESLYATGQFGVPGTGTSNIARWDGSQWQPVGGGLVGAYSNAIKSFNGDLIAAGYFDSAAGVAGSNKLARWDGTQWNSMDAQSSSFLNSMWDLEVFDDGVTGEQLYIAGNYLDLNGQPALDHIAKWDGSTYTPVGGTIGGAVPLIVLDLHVSDLDGTNKLYAGGRFQIAGGASVSQNIAKWDGSSWSSMGDGFDADVQELVVFDDGSGEALYAFGNFTMSGATVVNHAAKWNGTSWEPVGSGANANIFGGGVFDYGEGPALVMGGSFTQFDGVGVNRVASLTSSGSCPADLTGDGTLDFFDVSAFLSAYNAMNPIADFTDDGVFDFFDVSAFLSAYNAGCP
jgi:hypothetical protein